MIAINVAVALGEIIAANLPADTEPVIIRLLDGANFENGQANTTWPEYLALCGCTDRNAARRHLTRAKKAGIIHYSTNDFVYVTFLAWMTEGEARAGVSALARRGERAGALNDNRGGSDSDEARAGVSALARRGERAGAPNSDATYTPASAGSVGWLVGSTIPTDQQDQNQPTPLPPTGSTRSPTELPAEPAYKATETERAMSWALLTKSGMLPKMAAKWARCQPFDRVRDAVGHWYTHRKSQGGEFDEEPKILNDWFENWEDRLIPPLTAWRVSERSPLWPLRDLLFTPTELEAAVERAEHEQSRWNAEQARKGRYVFEERRGDELSPTPPGCGPPPLPDSPFGPDGQVDPVAAWTLMQAELKTQIDPGAYDAWVRDTWAVDFRADTGVFIVGLNNNRALDWMNSRLKPKLQRALGSLLGGKITVEFVVIQGGPSDV